MRALVRRSMLAIVALSLLLVPLGAAHLFNHQSRHEDCEIYGAPQGHAATDGHAHWHHNAAGSAHNHAQVPSAAGHTHTFVAHDPCNQVGMVRPGYAGVGPIQEISVQQAVIGVPGPATPVVVGDEAYLLAVPALHEQTDLVIQGDQGLRAMGFPGTGTPADPFIIEGYLIRNVLMIKDTSLCVVVRNNVVQSLGVPGPIVDPDDIIDRRLLDQTYQDLIEDLVAALEDAEEQEEQSWQTLRPLSDQAADYAALLLGYQTQAAGYQQQSSSNAAQQQAVADAVATAEDRLAQFGVRLDALVAAYEAAAAEFEAFLGEPGPAETYTNAADDATRSSAFGTYTDRFAAFAAQQAQAAAEQAWQDEYDAHLATLSSLASQHDALSATTADLEARLDDLRDEQGRLASGAQATQAARDAFQAAYDAFLAERAAFLSTYAPLEAAYQQLVDAAEDLRAQLDDARDAHAQMLVGMADGLYEYAGEQYDSLADLARDVAEELAALLDETKTGRLILDWNGQCLHVHHNVVEDLRVNRNNRRTGFATGGLLEDNRIHTIGQIRHYDGEFRENEVGDRAFLYGLVPDDPRHVPLPASVRAINNDGANQGWFHHNLIYGSVDLDFHGHHHGAGFFAPESHYHGSDRMVGYMWSNGQPVLLANGQQAPHHDHTKRWTSVVFEQNTIVDPLGYGLRFEDRDHAGDDRFANSEDMRELDYPHFHRTYVALTENTVVGSVWVDVFNAEGIEVWDDDYTEVKRDTLGRIIDAINHLGADIVSTHPHRNNGWVDVQDNHVFLYDKSMGTISGHYGWSAYQFNDAKQADLAAFEGNKAFVLPKDMDPGYTDAADLVQYLEDAASRTPASTAATVASWAGGPRAANSPALIGVLMKNLKDSNVTVCQNAVLGYQVGLKATDRIYTDVSLVTCGSNDWGAANPRVDVAFTPYPPPVQRVTDPLRQVTDPTVAEHVVAPVYDVVDPVGQPVAPQVNQAYGQVSGLLP